MDVGVCRAVSISVTSEEQEYAGQVAARLKTNRSDVYRRGLRALKKARHDYTSPLQAMLLLADELEYKLLSKRDAAGRIRRLVREMDAMRREAVEAQ
jgi:hypothetical protein